MFLQADHHLATNVCNVNVRGGQEKRWKKKRRGRREGRRISYKGRGLMVKEGE